MLRLGRIAVGRDNNFTLIRLAAAAAVVLSHAWPIALGPGTPEPLQRLTGHTLGELAVLVFFAISGFFVAASFARARSTLDFAAARVLRLFPGLAVSLLLVAFLLGPVTTALPPAAYLADPATWSFVPRGLGLVHPQYSLPGVFEANPYPMVEGSIWTLVHEALCYLLGLAGAAGLLAPRRAGWVLAAYGAFWLAAPALPLPPRALAWRELSLPFALGVAAWIWRDRVVLSGWVAAGLAGLAVALGRSAAAPLALAAALTYGTLWAGFTPAGAIRRWNRLGDYSYGLYIYAFPVQGLVQWLAGPVSPLANAALTLPPALALAVLSWHLVEKPALALRRRLPAWPQPVRRAAARR